uniref:Odorant receptor n=1 Tax=Hedya nubiferana TaxID=572853 RepID=A0A223HCY6_9NEOP|nr:putative odorant receptor OR2.2 [Hedya nubiferana]
MTAEWIERFKIFLNDAEGIVNPLHYRYMKQTKILMTEVASWPYKVFGDMKSDARISKYNIALILLGICLPFLSGGHLYTHADTMNFNDMGNSIIIIFLDFIFLQRLVLARTDKFFNLMKLFINKFHLIYFKNRSAYAEKVFHRIHLISGVFTMYIFVLLHFGILVYNLIPVYGNYKNGMFGSNRPTNSTFGHSAYYYVPKDYFYITEAGYVILAIINLYLSLIIAGMLTNFDLVVYLIVFQIWGHLKVLKHDLYSFPRPKVRENDVDNGMYTPEENFYIRKLLSDNIEHHQLIIKFVDECSYVLGEYLFMFYANIQVISCLLLLEMASMTAGVIAKFAALFLAIFISLIQCSVLFELVNTKSMELENAVYQLPWECMDVNNRKTVIFFLYRCQTPLSIKAGKIIPVGVTTMLAVLKTSCSYFMLLQTLTKEV